MLPIEVYLNCYWKQALAIWQDSSMWFFVKTHLRIIGVFKSHQHGQIRHSIEIYLNNSREIKGSRGIKIVYLVAEESK